MNSYQDRSHLAGHLQNIPDYMLLDKGHTGSKEFHHNAEIGRQAMYAWASNYAALKQGHYSPDGGAFGEGYRVAHREWNQWATATEQNIRVAFNNYNQVVQFNADLLKRVEELEQENQLLCKTRYWTSMLLDVCARVLERLMNVASLKNYVAWVIVDQYASTMIWHRDSHAGVSEGLVNLPHVCPDYLNYIPEKSDRHNNCAELINNCISIVNEIKADRVQMTIGDRVLEYQGVNEIPVSFKPMR